MPVRVGTTEWIVTQVGVIVERARDGPHAVPCVTAHEPTEGRIVVTSAEVAERGRVPGLTSEAERLGARAGLAQEVAPVVDPVGRDDAATGRERPDTAQSVGVVDLDGRTRHGV